MDFIGKHKAQEIVGELGLLGMHKSCCNFDLLVMTFFKHRDSVPIGLLNMAMIGR